MRGGLIGAGWVAALVTSAGSAVAQDAGPAKSASPDFTLSTLLDRAGAAQSRLFEIDAVLEATLEEDLDPERDAQLETLDDALSDQIVRAREQLAGEPDRAETDAAIRRWRRLVARIEREKAAVEELISERERIRTELREMATSWRERLQSWLKEREISSELGTSALEPIRSILQSVRERSVEVTKRLTPLLVRQKRLAELERRAAEILVEFEERAEQVRADLLEVDGAPLWKLDTSTASVAERIDETRQRIRRALVDDFWPDHAPRVPFHGLAILVLLGAAAAVWLRRREYAAVPDSDAARLAARPFSAALVLGFFASLILYPDMPVEATLLIGLLGLVPVLRFTAHLVGPPQDRLVWALGAVFVVHRAYIVLGVDSGPGRLLMLAGGVAAIAVMALGTRSSSLRSLGRRHFSLRLLFIALPVLMGLVASGLVANVIGLADLSSLLIGGSLRALYGVVAVGAVATITVLALRIFAGSDTGRRLRSIRLHRTVVEREATKWIEVAAVIFWGLLSLDVFDVREVTVGGIMSFLRAPIAIGSAETRLLDGILLVFTLWLSLQLARLIRFVLDEEVLPPLPLARGVPTAISRGVGYTVVAVGFLVAVAAAGIDVNQLTVIFGAFGVGIGFGLQNLVNNFVSGLILVFERPVQVGDLVEFQDRMGHVQSIGIRASIVRTFSGAEVIVPNGDLVSHQVINWNLSDRRRRIEIPVLLPAEVDPKPAIDVMVAAAIAHENVVDEPAPQVMAKGFDDGATSMELWCWTADTSVTIRTKSELTFDLVDRFRAAGVRIAIPRRALEWDRTTLEKGASVPPEPGD